VYERATIFLFNAAHLLFYRVVKYKAIESGWKLEETGEGYSVSVRKTF
jgi:hypothetical protein